MNSASIKGWRVVDDVRDDIAFEAPVEDSRSQQLRHIVEDAVETARDSIAVADIVVAQFHEQLADKTLTAKLVAAYLRSSYEAEKAEAVIDILIRGYDVDTVRESLNIRRLERGEKILNKADLARWRKTASELLQEINKGGI